MDPLSAGASAFLTAWGPPGGIIVFLGWAYWQERKARIDDGVKSFGVIAALNETIVAIQEKRLADAREALPILSAALEVMKHAGENARRLHDTLERDMAGRRDR